MHQEYLEQLPGKQETSQDVISTLLVKRIAVTFDEECPMEGDALPPLWHWAFFQNPVSESELGPDGHPTFGNFPPPVRGRNRMWAGGRVTFIKPLTVGQEAERRSTIISATEKQGQTGALLFVIVEHQYIQNGELCLREEQDIVYREPTPAKLESHLKTPELEWEETICPSSVMLFRYSAITFNGHRIHYDAPYVTEQEGYPGLVVHGPMIATLLLNSFLRQHPQRIPHHFTYRGLRPLIANTSFQVGGHKQNDQCCGIWAFNANGPAHHAEVEYRETH